MNTTEINKKSLKERINMNMGNFKTIIKNKFFSFKANIKTLKKFLIIFLILSITIWLFLNSELINFLKVIAGIIVGCLIPFLFDETQTIIKLLRNIKEKLNPDRYERTFELYNERLFNFVSHFYFFLLNITTTEIKETLINNVNGDISTDKISKVLKEIVNSNKLYFQRITIDNKITFNEISYNKFKLAEGELSDIYRILKSLPQELDFTIKKSPKFINMQSGYYQLARVLANMPESNACEAVTIALIKDIISFIDA